MRKYFCDVCSEEDVSLVELSLPYVSMSRNMNTRFEPLKEGDTPASSIQMGRWELCHTCSNETHKMLEQKRDVYEKEKS